MSDFKKWYKQSFETISNAPDPGVWLNIVNTLDAAYAKRFNRKVKYFVVASAVSVISGSLLFFGMINNQPSFQNQIVNGYVDNQNKAANNGNIINSGENKNNLVKKATNRNDADKQKKGAISSSDNYTSGLSNDNKPDKTFYDANQPSNSEQSNADYYTNMPILHTTGYYLNEIQGTPGSSSDKRYDYYNPAHNILPKGLYTGVNYSYSNVWVFNQDTWNALKKSGLSENKLVFNGGFSIVAGININDKNGFESEVAMKNQQQQKLNGYNDIKYVEKELSLNYSKVSISYKRKSSRLIFGNKAPASLGLVIGAYYSNLELLTRKEDNNLLTHKSEYQDYDYGINLGTEYDIYFNKSFAFTGGIRTSLGLFNIYKGNDKIPGEFNNTRNFSIGINMGIKYILSN